MLTLHNESRVRPCSFRLSLEMPKCSLIETKGVNVFLYKSELKSIGGDNSVCIVQGINEGIYLLRIMRELLE